MQDKTIKDLETILNKIPFNKMIGMEMEAVKKDCIILKFPMKEELIGNFIYGILHGGVTSSVLDMAGGAVAMFVTAQKYADREVNELSTILGKASTVNLNINYLRPGKGTSFTAKAKVLHSGNKITFVQMELFNEDATLIATGTGAYLVG
jgi:uncharacterized protein (TIGR00369 family)